MKIGLLISNISKTPAGLERYQLDFIKSVIHERKDDQFFIYTKSRKYLEEYSFLKKSNIKIITPPFGQLWRHIGMNFVPKADLYIFCTPYVPLFFKFSRSIVIVQDIFNSIYKTSSLKVSLINKINDFIWRLGVQRADRVVAISKSTKQDLIKHFRTKAEKIEVIYSGFNTFSNTNRESLEMAAGEFFLAVGTIKPRKNTLNIIKAFNIFLSSHGDKNIKLVIIGKNIGESFYFEEINNFIIDKKLQNKIIFLNYTSDEKLAWLYEKAIALVFPSVFEGFGLPIAEAMNLSLPVITSNYGAMEEVAGEAATLVDPKNPEDIAARMEEIYSHKNIRAKLIVKGKERVMEFSWLKLATRMSEIIDELKK